MLFGQSTTLLYLRLACHIKPDSFPDLPGRGYSSTPSPDLYPQSSAFFTTIILIVLASSSIAWAGPSSFSILGYSLGGGIVVNFVSCFPNLVSSVILLAPSGLIRPHHFGWQNKLLYSDNFLPDWVIERLVRRKLRSAQSTDSDQSAGAVEDKLPNAERVGASLLSERKFNVTEVVVSRLPDKQSLGRHER